MTGGSFINCDKTHVIVTVFYNFKVYRSVTLSAFTLCNHCHHLQNIFITPN